MAAYVVASLAELTDTELMSKYAETATPTVTAHGGKFLASGDIEKLDGEWNAFSGVVIEFPNKEAAQDLVQLARVPGGASHAAQRDAEQFTALPR